MAFQGIRLALALFPPVLILYLGFKAAVGLAQAWRLGNLFRLVKDRCLYYGVVSAANVALLGCFLYGWLVEAHWVELVHQRVVVRATSPQPHLRIAHLSDLHMAGLGRRERKALDMVRDAKADLICLTGDYLSSRGGTQHAEQARGFFRELHAPYGVYAVHGNWDWDLSALFENSPVELLADRSKEMTVRGIQVALSGCRFGMPPKALGKPPADGLNILLQHDPDLLAEASEAGYDLVLAGHTHGGQVRLPGIGALVRMSKYGYDAGLFSLGDTHLYVSRGLGTEGGPVFVFRFLCRPKVTVIDVEGGR